MEYTDLTEIIWVTLLATCFISLVALERHNWGFLGTGSVQRTETTSASLCDCELSHNGLGLVGRECDCLAGNPIRAGSFARGQRDMQHRAAEAIIKSSVGNGCTKEQRQMLAEACAEILELNTTPDPLYQEQEHG